MTKAKPLAAAKAASTSKKFYVVTNVTSRATFVKLGLTPVYLFDDWDASYAKAFKGRDAIIVSELDQEGQGGSLDQIASIARALHEYEACFVGVKLFAAAALNAATLQAFHNATVIELTEEIVAEPLNVVLDYVRLSDVQAKPYSWLWDNRIARGKINIISGDPDATKSTLTFWISARCSRGDPWLPQGVKANEGRAPKGSVIILSCEDGVADTIVPRICASGGDCEKIIALRGTNKRDKKGNIVEGMFNLLDDLPKLERLLKQEGDVVLLVIDPLNAFFGSSKKVDAWRDQDVRAVLSPLAKLAEKYDVAVLIVAHNVKGSHQTALARISGSVGIGAISRLAATVMKARDEDGEEMESRRLFLPMKKNIAVAKGIVYDIIEQSTGLPEVPKAITVALRSYTNKSADEAMQEATRGVKKDERLDKAVEIIMRHIKIADAAKDRAWSKPILEELTANSLRGSVVDRAKERLGIRALKDNAPKGGWYWFIDVTDGMPTPEQEHKASEAEASSFDISPEDQVDIDRLDREARAERDADAE